MNKVEFYHRLAGDARLRPCSLSSLRNDV